MTSSSHDFDPITGEDTEEFNAGLEYGKPTEILQIQMAHRALSDGLSVLNETYSTQAGTASAEEVERISKLLNPANPSDDEGKVAKYPQT